MVEYRLELKGMPELNRLFTKLPEEAGSRQYWRSTARRVSKTLIPYLDTNMPKGPEGKLMQSHRYKSFSAKVYGGLGGYVKSRNKPTADKFQNPSKASVIIHNRRGSRPIKSDNLLKPNPYLTVVNVKGDMLLSKMEGFTEKFIQRQIKKLTK